MSKIAVILFNLGSPDSKEAIEPFLMNFFMDKNIINLPLPFRYLLAKRISTNRSKNEASNSYGEIGNKSPLLENSMAQVKALEISLNLENNASEYKVFISMRYWHPFALDTVKDVQKWGADEIILLPLYPQFSTTTTKSSFESWDNALKKTNYKPKKISRICCYPTNDGFISASVNNIYEQYIKAVENGYENPRVLFSAHGLPEKIIKAGDPYQYQCEISAKEMAYALAKKLGIDNLDWQICYQSRVGRLKWITPPIKEALDKASKDNKAVIIYPHAFTQEHVETLVELDIEYNKYAKKLGIEGYYRAQTVGTSKKFIDGLAELVKNYSNGNKLKCCDKFEKCYNNIRG